MLLCLGGCLGWRDKGPTPVELALATGDERFDRRAEGLDTLNSAIEAYLDAQALEPERPTVLARLARAYNARAIGYAEGDDRARDHLQAREFAYRCMLLNSGYAARLDGRGGQVNQKAVMQLTPPFWPCAEEALVAGLRWVELRGVAGAVELEELSVIAAGLQRRQDTRPSWTATWGVSMATLLRPQPLSRDLTAAAERLRAARALEPGLWLLELDEARLLIHQEQGVEAARTALQALAERAPPRDGPWALENAAARRKAEEALLSLDEGDLSGRRP
ncbi:hypothetical protein L6R49_03365 [Myxococcota bacterium]|nr:hypothetical protein [Myxococcota bacterium]